ncbi:aminoglycoside phosphotransferase family protein [Streptomyces sp. NBC_01619]|uniref:Aminoglycoside phosphotransferase family protein n=1 Tax=Streptomyces pratisoli TaxID=3139917 RepID=A0ACC6QIN8_9ACTN|nr:MULTISPECIES: aminoglycoside phosphotransferase family protein [unclassified Streptomyces]MCX4511675.1 aminoglycoside phosphotransferase family protein [Streptomyces sp. NBC_01619]
MVDIPDELVAKQIEYNGEAGRAFVEALPGRAAEFMARWGLRVTGPSMSGVASLVLPVVRVGDGTRAALKLQLLDEETEGEPLALRVWDGAGAVRLLDHDAGTGTMLLERLDEGRHLSALPDGREAVRILGELLARLTAVPAPPVGLRRLGDIAARMSARVPGAVAALEDEEERRLLRDCAAAVREVAGEPGDRLLHWDLHYDNVLAAEREPWLSIDPKPLAGDPGFELFPALWNRFDADDTLWRFDLLTERLGLDRARARAWTVGRVLQNGLWRVSEGAVRLPEEQVAIARMLLAR